VRVLLAHSDTRPFETARFGAAWERGGGRLGELVPITPATSGGRALGRIDGLVLTGGPDVEPSRYGAEPEPGVELHVVRERDALDLSLLDRAAHEGWPVLAVCYGLQVLNVHAGGTLIQDLERAGYRGHRVPEPKDFLAHPVRVAAGSVRLAGLPPEILVNSRHHQAIATVGAGLRVAGTAPDGLVEAIEGRDGGRFVLGIQWHPENIAAPVHDAVFRRFREAVRGHARARSRG